MNDQLELLRQARPTDDDLDRLWPDSHRDLLLDGLLSPAPAIRPARRPRRAARLVAAVAATVTAIAVVPHVLNGGNAQAQEELRKLATVAANSDLPVVTPGQYLHVVSSSVQHNYLGSGDAGATHRISRDDWSRWDGTTWAVITSHGAGDRKDYALFEPVDAYVNNPTPQFAASLPTSTQGLYDYLDDHVQGSNSHNDAMFTAVGDLMHSQFVSPKLLSALLGVLARIDHVRTQDVTVGGRPAVRISYRPYVLAVIEEQTITVDRATAHVIASTDTSLGTDYEESISSVEVVKSVPAKVTEILREHPDGYAVCPDGSAPTSDGGC